MNNRTMIHIICLLGVAALWFFTSCKSKKDNSISNTAKSDKLNNGFVKKGDTIWFHDVALENVDPKTFELVDDYFFKDKDRVHFYETYRVSQDYFTSKRKKILPLENANPASFVVLGEGYAKDNSTAWYIDGAFKVDHLESMKVLNHHFVVDNKTAYLDRRPIAGSDGKTFELISEYYAKDANKYYYCTTIDGQNDIKPIDCHYESFVVIDHPYAKDKSSVFYEGDKLSEASSSTFELISYGYSRDRQHVFFRNLIVDKADPSTFITFTENENSMGETVYAKDKQSIFINDKRFSEADIATFKILDEKYSIDKNGVYFRKIKVKNADLTQLENKYC